jgi:AcrR family transcriptional regulator
VARTQSEKYPEIRENILAQAAKLFADKGYSGTTIVDLADSCGSSRGALYHYFDSKEDILFHILKDHVDNLYSAVQDSTNTVEDPTDQFREIVRTIVLFNARSQAEQIVLLNDLGELNADQQAGIVNKQRKLTEIVSDTLIRIDTAHRLNTVNKKAYTMMLFGMINYTFTWFNRDGPISAEAYADMTADTFLNGFLSA